MTRKVLKKFISLLLLAVFLFSIVPGSAAAQATDPTPTPTDELAVSQQLVAREGPDVYTLTDLGYQDQVMNGPFDYLGIRFRLPTTWALKPGTSVQLHIRTVVTTLQGTATTTDIANAGGATLDIQFNSKWVDTIVLQANSEQLVTVQIPERTFLPTNDQQNTLTFYLDAGIDCAYDHQTTVVISSDSNIDLVHEVAAPPVDLTQFPSPYYVPNIIVPKEILAAATSTTVTQSAILVVPDQPTAGELQAALTISAGLGSLTRGNLKITTIAISELTPEMRTANNIIFVGKGPGYEILQEAKLPAQYDGSRYNADGIKADDGLIQQAVSPWNNEHVLLIVSGESDSGVIKAGQALSSGVIRVSSRPDLAIISDVTQSKTATSVPVDRTLASLGIPTTQLSPDRYNGNDFLEAPFYIPPGQQISGDAYIDVVFNNSPLLDINLSGMNVTINGVTIGGVNYTEETSKSITTTRVAIPNYVINPGVNLLVIETNNRPPIFCSDTITGNIWTNIYDQTLLHIPLAPAEAKSPVLTTLNNFTDVLTTAPTLASTAFVVSPNSTAALKSAAQISYMLGTRMLGDLVELKAVYANQVPDDLRQGNNLLLVGKASEIPMVTELAAQLPAPFEANSNVAQESVFRVIYRMPADVSLGYLELLNAPWDANQSILAILGTTDEGIQFSTNALIISTLRNQLGGDFAVVRNQQVITSDTRLGAGTGNISSEVVPEVTPTVVEATALPEVKPTEIPIANQTGWIMPVVLVTSLIAILILVLVGQKARRK